MVDNTVSEAELKRRTILRTDWVPCNSAFIDCRTPGSDRKQNYSFIGVGVSQNSEQYVNLEENHGFNLGAAGMPNGVTNNLHMHFTAEVFINFGGEFLIRWGAAGEQGEYFSTDGDVISVPSWIFRGFTNVGPDDGILLTVLGHDVTGGIIWGPSVLKEAESYGLYLTADNRLRGRRSAPAGRRVDQADEADRHRRTDPVHAGPDAGTGDPERRSGLGAATLPVLRLARRRCGACAGDRLRHE